MTMRNKLFQNGIVSGALLLSLLHGVALACEPPLQAFERPRCEQSQLQFGICFNPEMDQAIDMMDSPDYKEQFDYQVKQAENYLSRHTPDSKRVIITDLDETLVDNRQYYSKHKVFHPETWEDWIDSTCDGPYYQNVLDLLKKAKQQGFSVMFVTGRPADQIESTLEQVDDVKWDGVFMRPKGASFTSTEYKTRVRQMLRELGFEIVLNIGDQESDFDLPVDPADGEFLLPNMMYSIP
jgi:predicted secreted acid phosphatase